MEVLSLPSSEARSLRGSHDDSVIAVRNVILCAYKLFTLIYMSVADNFFGASPEVFFLSPARNTPNLSPSTELCLRKRRRHLRCIHHRNYNARKGARRSKSTKSSDDSNCPGRTTVARIIHDFEHLSSRARERHHSNTSYQQTRTLI